MLRGGDKMSKKIIVYIIVLLLFPVRFFALGVEDIPNNQKPGTYPIELITLDENGEQISTTLNWTLKYPHTVISYEFGESIDAQDLLLTDIDVATLTSQDLIEKMKASAWSIHTGQALLIANVDIFSVAEKKNEYTVSFSTHNGTKTYVKLRLVDQQVLQLEEMYLYENEFDSIIQQNKMFFMGGIIIIPFVILFAIYMLLFNQTKKVKQLVVKH